MVEISVSGIEKDEALNAEYQSILKEMESAREKALTNATANEDTIRDRRIKFFGGAALLYFVALIVLISKKKTEKWTFKRIVTNFCAMAFCFGLGSLIGGIFTMIPIFLVLFLSYLIRGKLEIMGKGKDYRENKQK